MFVHSVEAQIFNMELDERIKSNEIKPKKNDLVCYENSYGFPDLSNVEHFSESEKRDFLVGNIVGYDLKEITDFEKNMLEELEITLESFKVDGLNELQSKGSSRTLFAPFKNPAYIYDKEKNSSLIEFSLPAGSYATVLLDEIIE
jgi:tRNA pseudouridine13 synthase